MTISYVVTTILHLNTHLRKCLKVFGFVGLYAIPLTSLQRHFHDIFQNCGMVKHYQRIKDPPFVNNDYLMASGGQ